MATQPDPVRVTLVPDQPNPKPPALSPQETLSRVDNYTNGLANRLQAIVNQTGPITLTDTQRTDFTTDIERLRAMGKEPHNPTAEPPHNPSAAPDFSGFAGSQAQPGPAPNNDARLAEASQSGTTGPAVTATQNKPAEVKK